MKYKLGISNGYGSNYITKRDDMWLLGLSCCVQQDQELPIAEDTVRDLINTSKLTLWDALEYDKDWHSICRDYNYNLEVHGYKVLHSYWDEDTEEIVDKVLFEGHDNFSLAEFVFKLT